MTPDDPWFASLPPPLQQELQAMGRVRKYAAGQRLCSRGEPVEGLWCIVEGAVRALNEGEPGRDGVLLHLEAPFWVGDADLFDRLGHTHALEAATDVQVMVLPQQRLAALLEASPGYWRYFGRLVSHKLRLASLALDELVRIPAEARIARRLVVMAAPHGVEPRLPHVLGVQQEHLAQMVGLSRGKVSPILQKFARAGCISLQYAKITIEDLDALRRIAGGARWPPVRRGEAGG